MAPIIPVHDRAAAQQLAADRLALSPSPSTNAPTNTPLSLAHCPLRELTQFECELRAGGSGYACTPFTRLFRECVVRGATKGANAKGANANSARANTVRTVRLEVTGDATV
ncbi:hypothetical protein DAKH74_027260 [Maudiozyma humilis]|uniref:Uncharacterized protein n=1 Tax=Maudiozyma humilis TaxID=51915 RepID=A0AAV5RWY7_MAUHU|nr:hypothetical protein DAKH74_027260 [Kazachstania humilis]